MDTWLQLVITSVSSVIASSGFWTYMQSKDKKKDATTKLLMGLAYDQITTLGVGYIQRGYIERDEYEELNNYFYEPYKALGGNGTAERIMNEVARLRITNHSKYAAIFPPQQPEEPTNVRVRVSPPVAAE